VRRRALLIVVGILLVAVVAADLVLDTVPLDAERSWIQRELSAALGLSVTIEGGFSVSLIPELAFTAEQITVDNLAGRPSPYLARIGRLELEIALLPLLFGERVIDGIELADAELRLEGDPNGSVQVPGDAEALATPDAGPAQHIALRSLECDDLRIFHQPDPEDPVRSLTIERASLDADALEDPLSVAVRGKFEGGRFELTGTIGPLAELLHPTRPFPVDLRGQVFEAELQARGAIRQPKELRGIDLELEARVPDLGALWLGEGGGLGPGRITARLTDPNGLLGIESFRAETVDSDREAVRARFRGSLRDLRELRGVHLGFELHTQDLALLEPLVERTLPDVSALEASAKLTDEDGPLGLQGQLRATGPEGGWTLDLVGGAGDLLAPAEVDLKLGLQARDLSQLRQLFELERELPPLAPVTLEARLRDARGTLGAEDIDLRVGRRHETWLELKGSVDDLERLRGVALDAAFGAADLGMVRAHLQRDLPDIGPLSGISRLSDRDGSLGVEHFALSGGNEKRLWIDIKGSFEDLRKRDEISVDVNLHASDLAVIGDVLGTGLPPIPGVAFKGRVAGSDEGIESDGTLRLDRTRVSGQLSGAFPQGARPSLRARLASPHLYLDDVGISPEILAPARVEGKGPGQRLAAKRRELGFDMLRSIDLDVVLHADRVTGRSGLRLGASDIVVTLKDGRLEVTDHMREAGGGEAHAELRVDARTPDPRVGMRAEIKRLDLTKLMAQFEDDTRFAGLVDTSFDLRSRGRTASALRANLSGTLHAVQRGGTLALDYSRKFVTNMVKVSLPTLQFEAPPRLGCIRADVEIDRGILAFKELVLAGDATTVWGEGRIDLVRGEYDLTLTPRALDPGLLSVAATVRVTGPLAEPRFSAVPRTIATSLVRGLFANIRRPTEPVVRTLARAGSRPDEDPCGTDVPVPVVPGP
jgi:hypothetical protein